MQFVSYSYSLPYVGFILFMILLAFWEFLNINLKRGNYWIRVITISSFLLFFGFRGFVGRDIFNYYDLFKALPTIWDWNSKTFSSYSYIEIGYRVYVTLIKSISANFSFFIFISVLIDVIVLDITFKRYSKYYVLSFILYIIMYGHVFEMEQLRNCKSVMLFLLSLPYLENKKFVPYLILNLIGLSFHSTSLIFIIAYFFLIREFSIYFYLSVFIVGNLLFLFKVEYIQSLFNFFGVFLDDGIVGKVNRYFNLSSYKNEFGFSIGYLERIITFILVCLIYRPKLIQQNRTNIIFINLYTLFFISFFFLSEMVVAVVRVSALFTFSYAIIYPNLYKEFKLLIYKYIFMFLLTSYASMRLITYHSVIEYKYENILLDKININLRRDIQRKSYDYLLKSSGGRE